MSRACRLDLMLYETAFLDVFSTIKKKNLWLLSVFSENLIQRIKQTFEKLPNICLKRGENR